MINQSNDYIYKSKSTAHMFLFCFSHTGAIVNKTNYEQISVIVQDMVKYIPSVVLEYQEVPKTVKNEII